MSSVGMPFGGKNITELFQDANFQNLLAGAGARLDPTGIGGALGGATIALNKSFGAQQVAEKQGEANQREMKTAIDLLNAQRLNATPPVGVPVTPPNEPGPTSIKANPDGTVTTTSTPDNSIVRPNVGSVVPNNNLSQAGQTILASNPASASTNPDTPTMLEGIQVIAPREPTTAAVVPTSNVPATSAPAGQRYINRGSQTPIDLQSFLPFYSRQRV